MKRNIFHNLIYHIVLTLFLFQAVSPVCITVLPARNCHHNDRHFGIGIVWLQFAVSSLTGSEPDDIDGDGDTDGDQVLTTSNHAISNRGVRVKPVRIDARVLPVRVAFAEPHITSFLEHSVPGEANLHELPGYRSCHTGLSPPAFLA